MKDLVEKILAYLPNFLTDFIAVFSRPKSTIRNKNTQAEENFAPSLIFLTISVCISVVMTSAFRPPGADIWSTLAVQTVIVVLLSILLAASLRLSWFIVGGKANFISFFVTYAYFGGIGSVIFTLFVVLSQSVFKVFDSDLYRLVQESKLNNQPTPDVSDSIAAMTSGGIVIFGYLFLSLWGIVSWGAYRELNNLSKTRSLLAFFLFGLISPISISAILVISLALA
jgi:hypothetical protein